MGSVTPLTAAALPEVAGYVEAVTADRVIGWAWGPREPGERAVVELRLGDIIIANAVAELPRADLASSGIGDGSHAFELAIPESCRDRSAELRVFARVGGGAAVAIGAPPQAEAMSDQLTRVVQGIDALIRSQRVVHGTLQASLSARPNHAPETAAIERLADQVATIERFIVRLDEKLLDLAPSGDTGASHHVPKPALVALGIASLALVISIIGLGMALGG